MIITLLLTVPSAAYFKSLWVMYLVMMKLPQISEMSRVRRTLF
jgi:hypothetical protein